MPSIAVVSQTALPVDMTMRHIPSSKRLVSATDPPTSSTVAMEDKRIEEVERNRFDQIYVDHDTKIAGPPNDSGILLARTFRSQVQDT